MTEHPCGGVRGCANLEQELVLAVLDVVKKGLGAVGEHVIGVVQASWSASGASGLHEESGSVLGLEVFAFLVGSETPTDGLFQEPKTGWTEPLVSKGGWLFYWEEGQE